MLARAFLSKTVSVTGCSGLFVDVVAQIEVSFKGVDDVHYRAVSPTAHLRLACPTHRAQTFLVKGKIRVEEKKTMEQLSQ